MHRTLTELMLLARRRAAQADEILCIAYFEERRLTAAERDLILSLQAEAVTYRASALNLLTEPPNRSCPTLPDYVK